jgi:drug/metabolite transporter (DMT)-like permease
LVEFSSVLPQKKAYVRSSSSAGFDVVRGRFVSLETWFLLAVLSAVLWGWSDIFAKLGTQKLGVTRIAVLVAIIDSSMYFVGFFFWHTSVAIGVGYAALAAASSFAGIVAYLCFFESILEGQIATVGTISAAYPALAVAGGLLFLSESPTMIQLGGVVVIIGGIIALSYERNPNSPHAMPKRSLFFALVAFALFGFWSLSSKIAVGEIGPGNVFGFYVISASIVPVLYVCFRRVRPRIQLLEFKPSWAAWIFGAMCLATNVIGTFVFSFALVAGTAALVVPVANASVLITVIVAVLLLKEKLNRLQLIALFFIIGGLFAIGITA